MAHPQVQFGIQNFKTLTARQQTRTKQSTINATMNNKRMLLALNTTT